jgi:hypothetical protein
MNNPVPILSQIHSGLLFGMVRGAAPKRGLLSLRKPVTALWAKKYVLQQTDTDNQ